MKEEYIAAEVHEVQRPFFGRYVSWSAIVAGLVVTLVIQILLTLLGVAIGAATIQPMQERNPAEGLGWGASIWWFVTALIALFIGAFVAGRLAGIHRRKGGALHGFLMWSAATVVTFMVAGTMMGGIFATGFSAVTQPGNRKPLMQKLEQGVQQMGMNDQNNNNAQSPANPYTYSEADSNRIDGTSPLTDRDRDFAMTNRDTGGSADLDTAGANLGATDVDDDRAAGNTNLLNQQNQDDGNVNIGSQEETGMRQAGEAAADTTTTASIIALVVLLIGAGVCTWAGSMGAPHDYVPPREHDTRVTGTVPGEPVKG